MSKELFLKIIINFILGGTIVSSVSYLATFTSPVIAAILWSFPLSIMPSIWFIHKNGKSNKYISKFLLSTTFAFILLFLCTLVLSYYFKKSKMKEGIFPSIIKSTIWWIIFSLIFYIIITNWKFHKFFI